MRALMEHMVEQHRKDRERNKKSGYETVYVKEKQQTKDKK